MGEEYPREVPTATHRTQLSLPSSDIDPDRSTVYESSPAIVRSETRVDAPQGPCLAEENPARRKLERVLQFPLAPHDVNLVIRSRK